MAGRVGGFIQFTINGQPIILEGSFTITPGGPKREAVEGPGGGGIGYVETIVDGQIECNFATVEALKVKDIRALRDVAFSLRCANGRVYNGDSLYFSDGGQIDPTKGTVNVTFKHVGPINEV